MDSMNKSPPRTRKAVQKVVHRNEMSSWLHRRGKSMPVEDLTEDQRHDIQECFDLFDADGSGSLDMDEVLEACNVLGLDVSGGSGGGGGMIGRLMGEMDAEGIDELDYPRFESVVCKTLGDIALLHARKQIARQETADNAETDVLAGTRDRAMVFKRKQLMGNLLRGGSDLAGMVRDQEELIKEITARFRRVIKMDGKRSNQEQVMELLNNLDPVASAVAPGLTKHFKHLQNMAHAKMKAVPAAAGAEGGDGANSRAADSMKEASTRVSGHAKHFVSDKRVISSEEGVLRFRCGGDVIVTTPRRGAVGDASKPPLPTSIAEEQAAGPPPSTTPIDARQALRKQGAQLREINLKLLEVEHARTGDGEDSAVDQSGKHDVDQSLNERVASLAGISFGKVNNNHAKDGSGENQGVDDAGWLDFLELSTAKLSDERIQGGACLRAIRISDFYDARVPTPSPSDGNGLKQQRASENKSLSVSTNGDKRPGQTATLALEGVDAPSSCAADTETAALSLMPGPNYAIGDATSMTTPALSATPRDARIVKSLPTASYSIPLTTLLSGPVKHDDTAPAPSKPAASSKAASVVPRLLLNKISAKDVDEEHRQPPQISKAAETTATATNVTSSNSRTRDGDENDTGMRSSARAPAGNSPWPTAGHHLPPLMTPSERRAPRSPRSRHTFGSITHRASEPDSLSHQSEVHGNRGYHTDREQMSSSSRRHDVVTTDEQPVVAAHSRQEPLPRRRGADDPGRHQALPRRRRQAKGQSNFDSAPPGSLNVVPRSRQLRPIPLPDKSPNIRNATLESLFAQVFLNKAGDDDASNTTADGLSALSASRQPHLHTLKTFPTNPI